MKKILASLLIFLFALSPLSFSFSDTLDTATPAGSDDPTQGDDRIRELKRAFVERLAVEHIIPASGSTYDGATVGYHKLVRLSEQVSAPSTPASYGALYTKDSGGQPELFFREESDGDEVQITNAGSLNVPDPVSIPRSSWRNMKVVRTNATTVTVTADEVILHDGSDAAVSATSVNEAIAITTSGAGGLDTGAEGSSRWYFVWIIRKSSDGTTDGLVSESSSSPTMPSDYDQKALVSAVYNNSSSDFVDFIQNGKRYSYTAWPTIASGNAGTGSWTSIDMSPYVPSALSEYCYGSYTGSSNGSVTAVTNDSSASVGSTKSRNKFQNGAGSAEVLETDFWQFNIITANTLYWLSGGDTTNEVWIQGFEITKLN